MKMITMRNCDGGKNANDSSGSVSSSVATNSLRTSHSSSVEVDRKILQPDSSYFSHNCCSLKPLVTDCICCNGHCHRLKVSIRVSVKLASLCSFCPLRRVQDHKPGATIEMSKEVFLLAVIFCVIINLMSQ